MLSQTTRAPARCAISLTSLQVGDDHHRISWRFEKHHLRVWLDRGFDVQRIGRINEIKLEVVVRENASEQTRRAAISVVGNDDVFAGLYESERCVDRRHA